MLTCFSSLTDNLQISLPHGRPLSVHLTIFFRFGYYLFTLRPNCRFVSEVTPPI